MVGPTSLAKVVLGVQPVGMNRAVSRPQAMNAPMFGITMPARNAPNFWTRALAPVPYTVGVYDMDMSSSLDVTRDVCVVAGLAVCCWCAVVLRSVVTGWRAS